MENGTNSWFEVSVDGMREIHGRREGWRLVAELVANAFDEAPYGATCCTLSLTHDGKEANLTVEDDGGGFRNLRDSYTVFGSSHKRSKPELRGRWNLGEKEIIAISKRAVVESSGKRVSFLEKGRRVDEDIDRVKGVCVTCVLPWSEKKVERTIPRLKRLLPPKGFAYTVNGEQVPYREPFRMFEAVLETVMLHKGMLRKSMRKTEVHLHKTSFGDRAMLFELGMPIQAIECSFHVDVRQKVPMNPNRDAVKPKFLQDLYAEVLNHAVDVVADDKFSQGWVRAAVEDSRTNPEVVQKVVTKRFGEKTVLWSSNTRANEKAEEAGFELIKPTALSTEERERMVADGGLKHASDVFSTDDDDITVLPNPDPYMVAIGEYAKALAKRLINKNVAVEFYKQRGHVMACYSRHLGRMSFNVTVLGRAWFKRVALNWEKEGIAKANAIILHELGHERSDPNFEHGPEFRRALEELAGRAVQLAISNPELFQLQIPQEPDSQATPTAAQPIPPMQPAETRSASDSVQQA